MKKRVNKKEEKNNGKILINIIIFVLLVIVIISLGYILLNSNITQKTNKEFLPRIIKGSLNCVVSIPFDSHITKRLPSIPARKVIVVSLPKSLIE